MTKVTILEYIEEKLIPFYLNYTNFYMNGLIWQMNGTFLMNDLNDQKFSNLNLEFQILPSVTRFSAFYFVVIKDLVILAQNFEQVPIIQILNPLFFFLIT